jgi:hypothetical protein
MIHVFRLLARFKLLRGTAFDPLGYTAKRKAERRLIEDRSHCGPAGDAAISLQSSGVGNTLSGHRPYVRADGDGTVITAIALRHS